MGALKRTSILRSMPTRELLFSNGRGQVLAGHLDLPVGAPPRAVALFAHCFTCGKDLRAARQLTDELTQHGVATLRFDFTGLGRSDGDFGDTSFTTNVQDIVAAATALEDELGRGPGILIGHSLGGAAVLHAASQIPSSKAVATIGAPSDPSHVRRLVSGGEEEIRATGSAEVSIGGRPFRIGADFLDSIEGAQTAEVFANLRRALLVLHSPVDTIVGVENAAAIYSAAKHPKSFVSLDGADHLLGREADARFAATMIATWAERYIDAADFGPDDEGFDVVAEIGETGFTTVIGAAGHVLLADEPASVGGEDAGPSPYDLLLSGLGACTAMTLRMYAKHKDWPLLGARVRLRHGKVHARDCDEVESSTGRIDVIDRELELIGPLDEEQRTRLMEIADKCPVHRTLHAEVLVRSALRP